ncbi:uncharacterized protein LOC113513749 isoform X2 [Galleria mellonella]|uniref:Uncharacterized protein LOC113513749 isoform X2 n=1 Tax=Galleria mellonella TaxID=7137 RepID=A0A6J1WHY4_GALME|nr:uncharacterized protein LOC113513749 isoform X2 [Galleria mellonella]
MLNTPFDSDGFQIVKTKRFSKNKQTKIPIKQNNFEKQEVSIDIEKSARRIQSAVEELRNSKYTEEALKAVPASLFTVSERLL